MLHVFDMDGTLLRSTTANAEIGRRLDIHHEVRMLDHEFATSDMSTREYALRLRGLWKVLEYSTIREAFEAAPKLKRIKETVQDIHRRNHKAMLITMAPRFFAELFEEYGFDAICASDFPRDHRELLDIESILSPEDKPRLAREFCMDHAIEFEQVVAYGDSRSDIAMFREARTSVSVNGDLHIQEFASHRYEGGDLWEAYQMVVSAAAVQDSRV